MSSKTALEMLVEATLPTEDELKEATDALNDAGEMILRAVCWKVEQVAKHADAVGDPDVPVPAPAPTFADIGALCVWRADVLCRLEEMRERVEDLGSLLTAELDELRLNAALDRETS